VTTVKSFVRITDASQRLIDVSDQMQRLMRDLYELRKTVALAEGRIPAPRSRRRATAKARAARRVRLR